MKITCYLLLAFLILNFSKSSAQSSDSIQHRILIIPFQPEYYISDADQEIAKQTRRTPDEYRAYFRKVLDLKIDAAISSVIPSVSLMQDTSKSAREDLMHYYAVEELKYDYPIAAKQPKEIEKRTATTDDQIKDQHSAPQYATIKGDGKFMNGTVADTAFFKSLLSKYNSDYLLSVNQFEIKTNYKSCIDIANHIYQRELLIHYTLLNKNAAVIQGNFAIAFFPSGSNRDTEIAERVFPSVAQYIKKEISSSILKK